MLMFPLPNHPTRTASPLGEDFVALMSGKPQFSHKGAGESIGRRIQRMNRIPLSFTLRKGEGNRSCLLPMKPSLQFQQSFLQNLPCSGNVTITHLCSMLAQVLNPLFAH